MSLSFPASPTNGQIYQNWIWSSAVGAWQPNTGALVVTSVDGMVGAVSTKGRLIELMRQVVPLGTPVAWVQFDNAFSAAYDEYELHCYAFSPTLSSGVSCIAQVAVAGVYDNGGNYATGFWITYTDGSTNAQQLNVSNQGLFYLINNQINNANAGVADRWGIGLIRFALPLHPTGRKYFMTDFTSSVTSGYASSCRGGAYWGPGSGSAAMSGIRVGYGTGQVAQGTFVLYGRIK